MNWADTQEYTGPRLLQIWTIHIFGLNVHWLALYWNYFSLQIIRLKIGNLKNENPQTVENLIIQNDGEKSHILIALKANI